MKIVPQKYRIAFVFKTLFYPFTYPEILNSLAARGYQILVPPQPLQSGARLYVSGPGIAIKAGCFIDVNEPKKIIACEGMAIDTIMVSAKDLVDLFQTDFKLDILRDVNYIELSGGIVVFNDNPIDAIRKFSGDQYKAFDEILGAETAGGSIRIIPKNGVHVDKNWFDINITQRVPTIDNEYYIEIVFRKENDIGSILDFISHLDDKISAIIDKIGSA